MAESGVDTTKESRRSSHGHVGANGAFLPSSIVLPLPVLASTVSVGLFFHGFDSVNGEAVSCIVNGVLLILLLLMVPPYRAFWTRAAPLLLLVAVAIAWAIGATFQRGGSLPDYASGKLLSLASGIGALLCGALLARGRRRRRALIDWLLVVNCAGFLIGLLARQQGPHLLGFWNLDREGRFTGLIGNANVTAAIAASFAIVSFSRLSDTGRAPAWSGRLRHRAALFHLPLFVLCFGVVLLTASRFTVVILGAMLIGLGALWFDPFRKRRWSRRFLAAVGVLIALLLFSQFSILLRDRMADAGRGGEDRVATWTHLAAVVGESPIYGYGLGSFPAVNAHFLTTPRFAQFDWALQSPHNLLLQFLLEGGVPYALLLVVAIVLGTCQVWRSHRRRWTRNDLVIALMIALIVLCSMVDIVLDMAAPVTLTLFLCGLLWGGDVDRSEIGVALPCPDPAHHEAWIGRRAANDRQDGVEGLRV